MLAYGLTGASPYYPLHFFGGLLLFAGGRLALGGASLEPGRALSRVLRWSDSYSYEVYLVHQVVILGDFSLATIFPGAPWAVVLLALAWSLAASAAVHLAAGALYRVIDRGRSKQ